MLFELGGSILGLLKAVPRFASWAEPRWHNWQITRVRRQLRVLRFWKDGALPLLEKISSERGEQQDLDKLQDWFDNSDSNVNKAAQRLRAARIEMVADRFGIAIANELDAVVDAKCGTDAIRPHIEHFLKADQLDKIAANDLVHQINEFNARLDRLHEKLQAEPKATSAAVRRRRMKAASNQPSQTP